MISYFVEKWATKIKVFFYEAWCSGSKIDISERFETNDLLRLDTGLCFDVYVEKEDKEKFENSRITRVVKADHTWKEKIRYIFSSEKVKDRCWCWTSFGFEKKIPKINLNKLKDLRNNFKSIKWK